MPNTLTRLAAYRLMDSPLAWFNPIYRALYKRRIQSRMANGCSRPETVALEVTNHCQSRCPMCAHPLMTRPKGVMSTKLFTDLLQEMLDWRDGLTLLLSGYGEPLLDTTLEEKVAIASQLGYKKIGFFTNAELLSPDRTKALVSAGLTDVWASIDATTPTGYAICRPGLDFERTYNNLKALSALRLQGLPRIHVFGVILPSLPGEWRKAQKFWKNIADDVTFRPPEGWAGSLDVTRGKWTPHHPRKKYPPCQHPWTQLNITWDGRGILCCRDFDARIEIGRFPERSPELMWKLPPLECYRESHSTITDRKGIALCEECHYYPVWW